MTTLANQIEAYIKMLLEKSQNNILELQRGDLAEIFMCVPSQINYVLETRFAPSQGYLVESRRGGGGYLRIIKLVLPPDQQLHQAVEELGGKPITEQSGVSLINNLVEGGFLTPREGVLIKSMINNNTLKSLRQDANLLRGYLLQSVLANILREDFEERK